MRNQVVMSRLNLVFGPLLATVLQAVVFASWHVGVTYTSSTYAGVDMPIYLEFLSYAA
jgi:membrane protease YdiL (CAAX protease family)